MLTASPSRAQTAPLAKRLWLAGVALAIFLLTCIIANNFVSPDKRLTTRSAGHDFLAFYTAGTFLRDGRVADLYKPSAVQSFEQQLAQQEHLELGKGFGPYWNPPVFAWLFVPLASLSYTAAWWTWFAINLTCAAAALSILCLIVTRASSPCSHPSARHNVQPTASNWRTWALVPLLTCTSLPFIMALGHGQNTCISLLLLSAVVWFWRKNQGIPASLICGLLSYKPQLAAVIAGMLVLTQGWRAILGLAITGITLLTLSALTLPGATHDWTTRLPALVKYMQIDHRYMWERHVTLKAFWRLLLQGYDIGNSSKPAVVAWLISIAALCFGMTFAVARTLLQHASRDRLIAATIASMPLLMPFYFDYDLLLLSVAAVLVARQAITAGSFTRQDKLQLSLWTALFFWMFINPFVAGQTHFNGTVLLLAALSGMLIAKACEIRTQPIQQPLVSPPIALAA